MVDLGLSRYGIKKILKVVQSGEVAGTDNVQTFTQLNTFSAGIILNNNIALQAKDTSNNPRNLLKLDTSNLLILGDNSVVNGARLTIANNTILDYDATGRCVQTRLASAGTAELLHKWIVSDASSGSGYIQIENDTATDAQFIPVLEALQGFTSSQPGFIIRAYHANDSVSTNPCLVLDGRFVGDVTLTVRPLVSIRNNGVDRLTVLPGGGMVHVITDPGANPEFYKAQISGNATAFFKIMDADPNTARFGPWLFAYNDNTSAFPALHIYAQIVTAADSGTTQGVMILDSRQSTGAVTVRPLLLLRNFGTEYWRANPLGDILQTKTAQAGAAELVHKWTLSDASDWFEISNNSVVDGQFAARIRGQFNSADTQAGLYIRSEIANTDTGATPSLIIDIRKADSTIVTVRPIIHINNAGTNVLQITAQGRINQTIIAQTGVAEVLHKWSVSDDANSFLQVENSLVTDAIFRPLLKFMSNDIGSNAIFFQCGNASDSGTNPLFIIDSRRSDGSAIATRPLGVFRNAGVIYLQANPKGDLVQTVASVAATAELLHQWQLDENQVSLARIVNTTGTDGKFSPGLLMRHAGVDNVSACGSVIAECDPAFDSGSSSILVIVTRTSGGASTTSRPIIKYQNGVTTYLQINPRGDFSHIITSAAGIAEVVHKWTISDDANSLIQIENTTAADGIFQPMIRLRNGTNTGGCFILGDTLAGQDTGSNPLITVLLRRSDATAIQSRTLLAVLNAANQVLSIGTNGNIIQTITAQATTAEILHVWKVSDDGISLIQIENGSATDAVFRPYVRFTNQGTSASAIIAETPLASDTGAVAIFTINARRTGGTAITTRPLFSIANNFADIILVNPATDTLKILRDTANNLTIFRNNNNAGTGTGIAFNMSNITPAEVNYGLMYVIVVTNTAGSEDGKFSFRLVKAGTMAERLALLQDGTLAMIEAANIQLGTATGTKIGTATTQKLAFYNATPIVQPAANADTSGATLAQLETEVNELKAMLRSLGLMAP